MNSLENSLDAIVLLKRRFAQAASALLLVGIIWQTLAVGANASILQHGTASLVATSADSISKQVSGKVDQVKGAAKDSMGRTQSMMENKGGEAKRKVKNDVNETKIAVDNAAARAGNGTENAVDAVKGFFGK